MHSRRLGSRGNKLAKAVVAPIDMSISTSGFSVGKKPANAGSRSALKMVQRPLRQDRLPKRIDKPTPDQDQDYPYQIIDLFSEVGHGLRPLQLPHEYGSQEENDRYRSQNDSYQLIHGESSQILRWPTYFTGAGSRWIAYHYADKSPDCQGAIFARHYGLVPRDKAPWKSRQPHGTRHMVAKVVGSLGPRTHGSASWRCAGR